MDLDRLSWPVSRLNEALDLLARRCGPAPSDSELPQVPQALESLDIEQIGRWIEWAATRLGLEAEPVDASAAEFDTLLSGAGPALLHHRSQGESRFLVLLKGKRNRVQLIGPDRTSHWRDADILNDALHADRDRPLLAEIDAILASAGVPESRRAKARRAMLAERLGGQRRGECWILRLPPSAGFRRLMSSEGLPGRLALALAVFVVLYGLEILGWGLIGDGALGGRLDTGWLIAWALLMLSIIPLQLLGNGMHASLALDAGRLLKQRLLMGALRLDPEAVRHLGAGQMLGRVIESQALESLALNGGLTVLVAAIELPFAVWILASGAGGIPHALLLIAWLAAAIGLSWRYYRTLRRWTLQRLAMTHGLIERMSGHRTCLAQESAAQRDEQQDRTLDGFLSLSKRLDHASVPLHGVVARGWLLLGLAGLTPAFVAGEDSPVSLAISLGGILLASRALSGVSGGLSALGRARIAWRQVSTLFHAAGTPAETTPFLPAEAERAASTDALISAHGLAFQYHARAEPILRQADLSISHGERILLEGPSGGGKSTLASLLVGLRKPDSGLLLLNGLDRHTLGTAWHRVATSAPQFHENHILSGTLAFNLLMGRRWPPTQQDLQAAEELCLALGLGELLERMPSGLFQMVGETGWQLSHGERSRVYLARALLQDAPLTVLDESFAALDPETLSQCLNCALERAPTLVVIAHP